MISRHTSDGVNIVVITAPSVSNAGDLRGECNHQHCKECERCESLEGVLTGVEDLLDKVDVTEEERVGLRFQYTESVRNIQAWKAHLLGSSNLDEAKQHILQKLELMSCHNGLGNEIFACSIQRTDE